MTRIKGGFPRVHLSRRTRIALGLCTSVCLATGGVLAADGMAAQKAATDRAAALPTTITVIAGKPSELAFKLSATKVAIGKVTFKVTNQGRLPHTFEICSSPKGGSANKCKGKVTPSLAHGKSATLIVTLGKGQYEYLCTVPGHAAAGMKGIVGAGVAAVPLPVSKPTTGSPTTTGPTVVPPATETLIGDPAAGRTVFTSSANPTCTSCHTLAAAGSTATVGPNLDSLAPGQADVVNAVTYGLPGGMPAFGTQGGLSSTQINNVAAFVYASTHH
jgi:cytochrome c6